MVLDSDMHQPNLEILDAMDESGPRLVPETAIVTGSGARMSAAHLVQHEPSSHDSPCL